jgi:hypothetical protein
MEVEGRWTALHIRKNTSGANNISLGILGAIASLMDFPPGYCHCFFQRLFKVMERVHTLHLQHNVPDFLRVGSTIIQ